MLVNNKYGGSVHEVWRRERFIKSPFGASCSMRLKREPLDAVCLPDDTHVFGFTSEEASRARRFLDTGARCPLIERNLAKADCLAIIERAGIELPAMYRLGFNNANCIGCCKGGAGYWNHVRAVFPEEFRKAASIEAEIGVGAYLFMDRSTKQRFGLNDLPLDMGRHNETLPSCSFFCSMAEEEIA